MYEFGIPKSLREIFIKTSACKFFKYILYRFYTVIELAFVKTVAKFS